MPGPEQHALLSASSSHRWLNCPPSARLAETIPERTSQYAEAGRVAHAIAELKARKYFLEPMSARTYNARLKKLREDPHYGKGMEEATDVYLDYLKSLAMSFGDIQPFVALETRVDYGDYAPEGFGTADCIIIGSDRLCVNDYKNGAGVPVEAECNSQMMLYALGALKTYGPIFGSAIQRIHLAIIQPNAGGVKEWECSRTELEEWGEIVVKPQAALAWAGKGEFYPDTNPNGWCKFCPVCPTCRAYSDQAARLAFLPQIQPELLSETELGERFALAKQFMPYAKMLEGYVEKELLAGNQIPGCKLVAGKTSREWKGGPDAAFAELKQRGVAEAILWERKPATVAGLEKSMGGKAFAEAAADLVVKKPGKPAAVLESDKRPAYNAAAIAFGGERDG